MEAYKCDRCKEYFETQEYKNGDYKIGKVVVRNSEPYFGSDARRIDLCPACKDSLKEWFEKYMPREDGE